jgi:hypothetical protein
MEIKKNAITTLELEFVANPNSVVRYLKSKKSKKNRLPLIHKEEQMRLLG